MDQSERGLACSCRPSRLDQRQPLYKPEYWDKIIELDQWTNKYDPVMTCLPLGIPRQGPPARIFHTENDITMIYRGGVDGGGGYAEFRMIPLDGKPHDPRRALQYTYMGYTVGRWEGDTLVLDSIGFSDETWLGRGGFFHSDKMRVVEKFTRTGNQMLYEVTVEDPEVLVKPWVMPVTDPAALQRQYDHRRAGKLHGERTERGQLPVSALSLRNALPDLYVARDTGAAGAEAPALHDIERVLAVWLRRSASIWSFPLVEGDPSEAPPI